MKPANVLLDKRSPALAKLTDFGIARSATDARLTGVGLTIGTAQYLSPEQALGGEVGPASDVYSLGLLLAECRSGRPAFAGTPIESALARLHHDPPIGDEAGELAPLLVAMTAREARDRPTAAEVAVRAAELAGDTAELPVVDRLGWPAEHTALIAPAASHPGAGSGRRPGPAIGWRGSAGVLLLGAVSSAVLLAGTDQQARDYRSAHRGRSPHHQRAPSRSRQRHRFAPRRPTPSRPAVSSHPVQVVATPPASPNRSRSRRRARRASTVTEHV